MIEHAKALQAWEADHDRWKIERSAWKKDVADGKVSQLSPPPVQPICLRTWTADTTTEALVALLRDNTRGVLMAPDELAGWFDFNRYVKGRGGGDVAKWLEMFGARPIAVDRKTEGSIFVSSASVSIASGIQPETLRRSLGREHRENGLAARFLFASPPRRPRRWTDDDVDADLEAVIEGVFEYLYGIELSTDRDGEPEPISVRLNPEARQTWIAFVNEHGAKQAERTGDEAAAWSKLEGYAARFALVIHMTRLAASDATIINAATVDTESVGAGIALVRWFGCEAERVYAMLDESSDDCARRELVEWIAGQGGKTTVRGLTHWIRRYRGRPDEAKAALDDLVESNYGVWTAPTPGKAGGRPTMVFVLSPQRSC